MIAIAGNQQRPLAELVRVAQPGARGAGAESMALTAPMPADLVELDERGHLNFQFCFRALESNRVLITQAALHIEDAYYFPEARTWWEAYAAQATAPDRAVERESSRRDAGRWLSLGVVVGRKL